jgi:hypothetical protein
VVSDAPGRVLKKSYEAISKKPIQAAGDAPQSLFLFFYRSFLIEVNRMEGVLSGTRKDGRDEHIVVKRSYEAVNRKPIRAAKTHPRVFFVLL